MGSWEQQNISGLLSSLLTFRAKWEFFSVCCYWRAPWNSFRHVVSLDSQWERWLNITVNKIDHNNDEGACSHQWIHCAHPLKYSLKYGIFRNICCHDSIVFVRVIMSVHKKFSPYMSKNRNTLTSVFFKDPLVQEDTHSFSLLRRSLSFQDQIFRWYIILKSRAVYFAKWKIFFLVCWTVLQTRIRKAHCMWFFYVWL